MIDKIIKHNWYFDFWIIVIASPLILRTIGAIVEIVFGVTIISDVSAKLIHDVNIILNGFYLYLCVISILLSLGLYIYEKYKR